METLNKLATVLMVFCINASIMVLLLGLVGWHKATLLNVDPLGATIDNFGLFGISATLLIGSVLLWLVRYIINR